MSVSFIDFTPPIKGGIGRAILLSTPDLTPQDGSVDGLPYKGNATGRTGPGTTFMALRSPSTVAGTFILSAFDFCQVFREAS